MVDLFVQLKAIAGAETITSGDWPKNVISMSMRLKTLKSQLSAAGVEVAAGRHARTRWISVQYSGRSS